MRLTPLIAVTAIAIAILSYSITMACDKAREDPARACAAETTAVGPQWGGTMVQVTLNDLNEAAGRTPVEQTYTTVKTSVRAGVNLTRALYRAAAHRAVVIARTVYHTAAAMT